MFFCVRFRLCSWHQSLKCLICTWYLSRVFCETRAARSLTDLGKDLPSRSIGSLLPLLRGLGIVVAVVWASNTRGFLFRVLAEDNAFGNSCCRTLFGDCLKGGGGLRPDLAQLRLGFCSFELLDELLDFIGACACRRRRGGWSRQESPTSCQLARVGSCCGC